MNKWLLLVCFLCPVINFSATAEDKVLAKIFTQNEAKGTIIISSLDNSTRYSHNLDIARQHFSPASTFKILNTLIALEEGAVENANSVIEWDGKKRTYEAWNKNQTLKTAFRVSCVWCYQEYAREIGAETYQRYLSQINLGILESKFNVTEFWLDDGFIVTTLEQIELLRQIYLQTLPFSPESYETLREVFLEIDSDNYTLSGKTGWAARGFPQIGWYIGYVETTDNVWLFATNLEIQHKDDLALRKKVTLEALRAKGILND